MVRHPAGKGAIHRPKRRSFFAALQEERPIGFCCLMSIGRDTAEPAVMGVRREFDEANRFSLSLGFREFEVFPKLWDEGKPSQVYVMALE